MHIVHNARITLLATALNSLALAVMAVEIPAGCWQQHLAEAVRARSAGYRRRTAAGGRRTWRL
jgi:hypothetical protein